MIHIKEIIIASILVVGGGLAGSEAAWQCAQRGCEVDIVEMRPKVKTHAHVSDKLAELVCSNSFRADDYLSSAIGLLHKEMRILNSIIMQVADEVRVPAGSALAVDREEFSSKVTNILSKQPLINVKRCEFKGWDNDYFYFDNENIKRSHYSQVIIATGPLTSERLSENIIKNTSINALNFFDAMAPIIFHDSIDFEKVWFQSRYDKGVDETNERGGDYINCPMSKTEYYEFVKALMEGEKAEFKDWEKDIPYFDGCLPIEVMVERGLETLRFGPLKPVGLTNPHFKEGDERSKPYAIVQLRQDNKHGTLYNMVGFQTKLKHAEQARVFRMIPGLENARFARLGGIHRNSYLNAPELLDNKLRLKADQQIRFAGQVSGVEGYVESAAMGLMCGIFASCDVNEKEYIPPSDKTALGALIAHVSGLNLPINNDLNSNIEADDKKNSKHLYKPMNVNFGLFPKYEGQVYDENNKRLRGRKLRKARREKMAIKAIEEIENWKLDKILPNNNI